MGSITDKLQKIVDTKKAIKEAIIAKGVDISNEETFSVYPDKILEIQTSGASENLLAGTYTGRSFAVATAEYPKSGNVTVVNKNIDWSTSTWDVSVFLQACKDFFETKLAYNSEEIIIDGSTYLKIYKGNSENGFALCFYYDSTHNLYVDIMPIIANSLNTELKYTYAYKKNYMVTDKDSYTVYLAFYFVKNEYGVFWGIGNQRTDGTYVGVAVRTKRLVGCSTKAINVLTNEETFVHCLCRPKPFSMWSDKSTDFTNTLTESNRVPKNILPTSNEMFLKPVYFYSEHLVPKNLFIAETLPLNVLNTSDDTTERNTVSFVMGENEYFSSDTTNFTSVDDYVELVFKL